MFRIRKDDYNTVELLPEYRSTTRNKNSTLQNSAPRSRNIIPVLLVILLVILLAGGGFGGYYFYKNYINTSSQYVKMLQDGNWDACVTLMKENGNDADFLNDIKAPVTDMIYQVQRDYKAGDINAEDALKALANYDEVTGMKFEEITKSISSFITNNEKLKTDIETIRGLCDKNAISEAYEAIKKLKDNAAAYGIDVSEDVTAIIKENLNGFKYVYFRQAATAMYNRSYDGIRSILEDLNSYVNDSDITEMLKTIDTAEKGELSRSKSRAFALEQAEKIGKLLSGVTSSKAGADTGADAGVSESTGSAEVTSTQSSGSASAQSAETGSAAPQSTPADSQTGSDAGAADTAA